MNQSTQNEIRPALLSFSILLVGLLVYFTAIGSELNQETISEASYILTITFAVYFLVVLIRRIIKEPSQRSILKGSFEVFVGFSLAGALWATIMFTLFYNVWLN